MKKIAITTIFHDNYNYGGILQAYALYEVLKEFGFDVTEIDYDIRIPRTLKDIISRNLIQLCHNPVAYFRRRQKIYAAGKPERDYKKWSNKKYGMDVQAEAFQELFAELKKTRTLNAETIKGYREHFSYAISGGDQVINPDFMNDTWFLKTISADYKFTYSASIGKDMLTDADRIRLKAGLTEMAAVSVRELQAKKIIDELGVQEAEVVIDPVGLLTVDRWRNFSKPYHGSLRSKNYVFAYILGEREEELQAARLFADKAGLPLVMIPHIWRRFFDWEEPLIDIITPGITPNQFVWILDHAKYILTDSFHGTMFSIMLGVPFICINRFLEGDPKAMDPRLLSILELFSLQNRMMSLEMVNECEKFMEWDTARTDETLDDLRIQGMDYLKRQLSIDTMN